MIWRALAIKTIRFPIAGSWLPVVKYLIFIIACLSSGTTTAQDLKSIGNEIVIQRPVPGNPTLCCLKNPGAKCCGELLSGFEPDLLNNSRLILSPTRNIGRTFGFESFNQPDKASVGAMIENSTENAAQTCVEKVVKSSVIDLALLSKRLLSMEGKLCSDDALAFDQLTGDNWKNPASFNEQQWDVAQNYISHCIGDPIKQPNVRQAFDILKEEIGAQVGFLHRKDKLPHCMATRIKDRVFTAKHCIGESASPGGRGLVLSQNLSEYGFRPINKQESVSVSHLSRTKDFDLILFDRSDDLIELQIPNGNTNFGTDETIEIQNLDQIALRRNPKILIPSIMRILNSLYPNETKNWSDMLTFDLSPFCRVGLIDEKFLLHSCQTTGGVSGAPILWYNKSREKFQLVGVHAGITTSLERSWSCASEFKSAFPNYAIPIKR